MRFKRVYIEITNTCNLTCAFCIQNERPPRRMTHEEFCHILDEIRPYTNYIYLHVLGEPLSHPNLDDFLTEIEKRELKVNITTNGTLLKKQEEVLKKHTIRQINVSLHSFPQHLHPTYFSDVFSVCESLAKQGIYINYRLWSLKANALNKESNDILEIIQARYALELQPLDIKRLQRIELRPFLSLHFEEVFQWPARSNPYVNAVGRCLGMKEMCAILSNGDVVPCCLDSKGECLLGNLQKQSFSEIITGEKAQSIVKGFANHKVEEALCQHCSFRLRFSQEKKENV